VLAPLVVFVFARRVCGELQRSDTIRGRREQAEHEGGRVAAGRPAAVRPATDIRSSSRPGPGTSAVMDDDRIADPWGARTPYRAGQAWPARVDEQLADGVRAQDVQGWVQSASLLHSNGDAMDIAVKDGRIVGVRGREVDRVNRGRLGPKDLFGWQANASVDRLTTPLVRVDGELVPTDWDSAMQAIVDRSSALLAAKGPGALGFYTTGQLFLEEYYTLATIAKAGIGTPHTDGNTRLCTATAGEALKETFGCDGQPGSYADVDDADVIALYGHNMAETQPVLWMRILDRLAGPDPPKLICVDPRLTEVARHADVHLALRNGTNVALLNALIAQIIAADMVDHDYVQAHTVGYDELVEQTREYTPEKTGEICGLDPRLIVEAAQLLGGAQRLVSTVLQGVYQSHQATAAAVQINNINLIRGALGRPGASVLQFNGQPTAQNTRETGADGDLPGFRNWANDAHVEDLASVWNVEPAQIPHYAPPTHVMQQLRYIEQGSIAFWWVSGTNPAVSLPELHRIRSILSQERLFLVVQDIFPTETTQLADVVLPAATWGEKTGCFTNVDRTVHLSDKAIDPPGQARADLDIFLDYARRMDFRDKDGAPLVGWHDAESAFEAWKRCSRGRPCDYTGLSHARLRGTSGIQWPCNDEYPDGTERLYADGTFWSDPDYCEDYGKDLVTGAPLEPVEYRALNPHAKAVIKAAQYTPPSEQPDEQRPYLLTTGRTIYHFHTRTKTARAPQLQAAAPEVWVELSTRDAASLGVGEGDMLEVASARGAVRGRARVSGIRDGVVFVPFHYGYWDTDDDGSGDHERAANELTITQWDPASKQPLFKTAAVSVTRVADADGVPSPAPRNTASAPVGEVAR
jgi:anaerobic selenocysteine-containing dehydrogenase